MNHFNLSDLESNINIRGVHAKTVVNHKNTTIKNLILNPGEAIGAHQVNVDVTFFVLEGEGAITIGDTTYQVVKNDVVLCPPATPMSIQASNEVGLSFLNIKTPGI
jgi:mannose-6-phosphate isomerase-like protein (cupin superfamily)